MHNKIFKHFLGLIFLGLSFAVSAQVLEPVKFKTSLKQFDDKQFAIQIETKIDEGWHLYSSHHQSGGIGIPAELNMKESSDFELIGGVDEEGKLKDQYSEIFDQQEKYYEKEAVFIQKFERKSDQAFKVEGELLTQVCDDSRCLPPNYFEFSLDIPAAKTETKKDEPKVEENIQEEPSINSENEINQIIDNQTIKEEKKDSIINEYLAIDSANVLTIEERFESCAFEKEKRYEGESNRTKGYWALFVLGFLGGFAALLMPCVFPMIPLTVSVFTKQSENRSRGMRNAFIFGLSIVVIYLILGLLVTSVFGASGLNSFATNPWVNFAFFVLFVVLAISFFGSFEIVLPSKWVNAADKRSQAGGLIGIFFMAFTLALVSFSCTGPIIGWLLVEAYQSGEYIALTMVMLGFSVSLALPFVLFALFPSWLSSLPKSGGWLNTVKVSLGFLELAFALKFLSNTDLVLQWKILTREVFIAIWLAIFLLWALYLLKVFFFSADNSDDKKVNSTRLLVSVFIFAFVFYLLPGLQGAPLKLLSGLVPPSNYTEQEAASKFLGENIKAGPHGIPQYLDFYEAAQISRKENKPMLIDFTGYACANCRKVEDNVWSDPDIQRILSEEVIVVSLYVDERSPIEPEKAMALAQSGFEYRNVGERWSAFQINEFESNSQPLYQIVDCQLNQYNPRLEAELDIKVYKDWLKQGIANYKKYN